MNNIDKTQLIARQHNIIMYALMSLEDLEVINHNDVKEIINILYSLATKEEKVDDECIGVHLSHCYQGEYDCSCKYGQNDICPANPNFKVEE